MWKGLAYKINVKDIHGKCVNCSCVPGRLPMLAENDVIQKCSEISKVFFQWKVKDIADFAEVEQPNISYPPCTRTVNNYILLKFNSRTSLIHHALELSIIISQFILNILIVKWWFFEYFLCWKSKSRILLIWVNIGGKTSLVYIHVCHIWRF